MTAPDPLVRRPRREEGGVSASYPGLAVERRIQRMGSFSVGISLPRPWLDAHHREVGDSLRLRPMAEGALLVWDPKSESDRVALPVRSDGAEPAEHLFRRLIAGYLTGAARLLVEQPGGLSPEARAIVRSFVRRTVQFEIATEEDDRLVLQDMTRGPELSVPLLLRRMAQMVLDLQRGTLGIWQADTELSSKHFEEADDEVDRYGWLIERVLRIRLDPRQRPEAGEADRDDPLGALLLARALERVADHSVRIVAVQGDLGARSLPPDLLRSIRTYHEQVIQYLGEAWRTAAVPDGRRVNEVLDAGEALRQMGSALEERLLALESTPAPSYRSALALGSILSSLDRVNAYAQDIAEVALDRSLLTQLAGRSPEPSGFAAPPRRSNASSRPGRRANRTVGPAGSRPAPQGTPIIVPAVRK